MVLFSHKNYNTVYVISQAGTHMINLWYFIKDKLGLLTELHYLLCMRTLGQMTNITPLRNRLEKEIDRQVEQRERGRRER